MRNFSILEIAKTFTALCSSSLKKSFRVSFSLDLTTSIGVHEKFFKPCFACTLSSKRFFWEIALSHKRILALWSRAEILISSILIHLYSVGASPPRPLGSVILLGIKDD